MFNPDFQPSGDASELAGHFCMRMEQHRRLHVHDSEEEPSHGEMRSFQGPEGLICLLGFLQRCQAGSVRVLGFRDFGYNQRDPLTKVVTDVQLEREIWVFDQNATVKNAADPNRSLFVVIHVHFPYRWDEEEKEDAGNRRWDEITQLNIRHSSSTVPFLAKNTDIGWARGLSGRSQVFASGRWTEQSCLAVPLLRTLGKGGWKWRSNSGTDELFPRPEYRSHAEWQRYKARMIIVDPKGQIVSTFSPLVKGDWKVFIQNALCALLHSADETVVKKGCMFRCVSASLSEQPLAAAAANASGGGGGGAVRAGASAAAGATGGDGGAEVGEGGGKEVGGGGGKEVGGGGGTEVGEGGGKEVGGGGGKEVGEGKEVGGGGGKELGEGKEVGEGGGKEVGGGGGKEVGEGKEVGGGGGKEVGGGGGKEVGEGKEVGGGVTKRLSFGGPVQAPSEKPKQARGGADSRSADNAGGIAGEGGGDLGGGVAHGGCSGGRSGCSSSGGSNTGGGCSGKGGGMGSSGGGRNGEPAGEGDISSYLDQVKRCVVQLSVFDRDPGRNTGQLLNVGSGTMISCRGHILTAAHNVLNEATRYTTVLGGSWDSCEVLVAIFSGDTKPARWAYIAKIVSTLDVLTKTLTCPEVSAPSLLDLAVLKITAAITTDPLVFSGIGPVEILDRHSNFGHVSYLRINEAPKAVEVGDKVDLYGYPLGHTAQGGAEHLRIATESVSVSQEVGGFLLVDSTAVAASGFSGGPLINQNGEIVGVMSKDYNNLRVQHLRKGSTNLSWFRRLSEVLKGHGLPTEGDLSAEHAVQAPSSVFVEKTDLAQHQAQSLKIDAHACQAKAQVDTRAIQEKAQIDAGVHQAKARLLQPAGTGLVVNTPKVLDRKGAPFISPRGAPAVTEGVEKSESKDDALAVEECSILAQMTEQEQKELAGKWKLVLESCETELLAEGRDEYQQQNFVEAIDRFERVKNATETSAADRKKAKIMLMYSHIQVGYSLAYDKNFSEASAHFKSALDVRAKSSEKRAKWVKEFYAWCLYRAGTQACEEKQWGAAEKFLESAVDTRMLTAEQTKKAEGRACTCGENKQKAKKKFRELDGRSQRVGIDRNCEAFELYKQGKTQFRQGNVKLARTRFRDAQEHAACSNALDELIDEYLSRIKDCLRDAAAIVQSECVFDSRARSVLPNLAQGGFGTESHQLHTMSQILDDTSKVRGISKAYVMVINTRFPRNSEDRLKLIGDLTEDLHQALNIIYATLKIQIKDRGSTIVSFRFVQHREDEESLHSLEEAYQNLFRDPDSRLYDSKARSLTHLIKKDHTEQLMTQAAGGDEDEVVNTRRKRFEVGSKITLLDIENEKIECMLDERLGVGASAIVFKVSPIGPSSKILPSCALKVSHTRYGTTQLCREASIMLTLNWPKSHPNVLKVEFVWCDHQPDGVDEIIFLTEHVEDGNLQEWMADDRLYDGSVEEQQLRLVSIAHQLASAVQHLHSCGVLHQDIKPENIVMTKEGKPVLSDFGSSAEGVCHTRPEDSHTVEANLVGATVTFSSPEHTQKLYKAKAAIEKITVSLTHLDDIWSLAATILDFFAECEWRVGRTIAEIVLRDGVVSLEHIKLIVAMPEGLQQLLYRCFSAHLDENSLLTTKYVMKELASILALCPGHYPPEAMSELEHMSMDRQKCSVVRYNLGLALQSHRLISEAQEQYTRAATLDSSRAHTIALQATNSAGQVLSGAWLEQKLRGPVQANLQRMLGAAHPVGCSVTADDADGGIITVEIVRASLWDQMSQTALLTDVGFLQMLRDQILTGEFEGDLTRQIRKRKENGDADGNGIWSRRMQFCTEGTWEAHGEEGQKEDRVVTHVEVVKPRFAAMYENSMLMLKSLTPHQAEVLRECCHVENGKFVMDMDVHIRAAAGAGKTFVALHISLRYLEDASAHVLFVAQNEALAYFMAKWLYTRTQDQSILSRFHVLYGKELKRGKFSIDADVGRLVLEEIGSSEYVEYSLLVVDEAHHFYSASIALFKDAPNAVEILDHYVSIGSTEGPRRLLLSDISQSVSLMGRLASGTDGMKEVVLNEVIRNTERIVLGAEAFQVNDADEPTKCHRKANGLPLKAFLFVSHLGEVAQQYAEKVRDAMSFLEEQLTGMYFHDRVAIIAPNTGFIKQLKPLLQLLLSDYDFIDAAAANQCISTGMPSNGASTKPKQCLVLDTVDNFNGLERLIVIATGLDFPIDQQASRTRSRLYRAITRAQMMVVVVNKAETGGWLEFLYRVDFDGAVQFDVEVERQRNMKGAARASIGKESRLCQEKAAPAGSSMSETWANVDSATLLTSCKHCKRLHRGVACSSTLAKIAGGGAPAEENGKMAPEENSAPEVKELERAAAASALQQQLQMLQDTPPMFDEGGQFARWEQAMVEVEREILELESVAVAAAAAAGPGAGNSGARADDFISTVQRTTKTRKREEESTKPPVAKQRRVQSTVWDTSGIANEELVFKLQELAFMPLVQGPTPAKSGCPTRGASEVSELDRPDMRDSLVRNTHIKFLSLIL
jgi:serine/threonine protein kinase/outer membrane protein assembly factor BamD (BamD/ComL family)